MGVGRGPPPGRSAARQRADVLGPHAPPAWVAAAVELHPLALLQGIEAAAGGDRGGVEEQLLAPALGLDEPESALPHQAGDRALCHGHLLPIRDGPPPSYAALVADATATT